jgi:hypothetical protein
LTVWFELIWRFTASKQGLSAAEAQRDLGIGSYGTAWAMCHRLRRVLVRPGRERLAGRVEVDEAYVGGMEPGLAGGRAPGKKILVGVAVEAPVGRPWGRARMMVLPDGSSTSLRRLLVSCVEPGATVVTDAWAGYTSQATKGYVHEVVNQAAEVRAGVDPGTLLPGVHRAISLVKRWLVGTHQGAVSPDHLQAYLDEWVFRFNRRASRSRELLFYRVMGLAVGHSPIRRAELTARPSTLATPPPRPKRAGARPASLDQPHAGRPWRTPPESPSTPV